jgi:6-phosphofructokinase
MCHCETTILPFLASQIADMVAQRAELGKDFGVVLIPEGLVEFMHDVSALIAELNELMAAGVNPADQTAVVAHLTPESADVSAGVWGSGSCVSCVAGAVLACCLGQAF